MKIVAAFFLVFLTACTSSVKEPRFYVDELKKTLDASLVKQFSVAEGDQTKAIDLKAMIEKECTHVVTRPLYLDKGKVEVCYPEKLEKAAIEIADTVAKISHDCMIKIAEKTQVKGETYEGVIYLLTNGVIKLYLLQFDKLPTDYKYSCTHILDDTIYEGPILITNADDLWNSKHNQELIDELYWTIPHELTHDFFRGDGDVRWFECGFGEYMAYTISTRHKKLDITLKNATSTLQEASTKTGKKIFEWKDEDDPMFHRAALALFLKLKEKHGHENVMQIAEKVHGLKKFTDDDIFSIIKDVTGDDIRDYVK